MRRFVFRLAMLAAVGLAPAVVLADDAQIARQVVEQLQQHKEQGRLKGFGVDLQVKDGVVYLQGHVGSPEQRNTLLESARGVPGVKDVQLNLEVRGQETAPGMSEASSRRPEHRGVAPAQATSSVLLAGPMVPQVHTGNEAIAPIPMDLGRQPHPHAVQPTAGAPAPARLIPTQIPQQQYPQQRAQAGRPQTPLAYAPAQSVSHMHGGRGGAQMAAPAYTAAGMGGGVAPAAYDHPYMPNYAYPSYGAYPNYGAVTYPKQYSPTAWPYIGPFYPYPQVPLGWRKVTLEWDDGWWMLDFHSK